MLARIVSWSKTFPIWSSSSDSLENHSCLMMTLSFYVGSKKKLDFDPGLGQQARGLMKKGAIISGHCCATNAGLHSTLFLLKSTKQKKNQDLKHCCSVSQSSFQFFFVWCLEQICNHTHVQKPAIFLFKKPQP